MNIELQSCALFIIFTIFVMFFREKKLDLMNRKLFLRALFACFLCLIFDIMSVVMISHAVKDGFSEPVTKIVCKLYIMLLTLQGYFSFIYASTSIIPSSGRRLKIIQIVYNIFFAVGEILILLLPIGYEATGRIVYSYGLSTSVSYFMCAVFVLSTIITAFTFRRDISGRRFSAMLLWQGVWLLAALIQFIFPQFLLVGFASAFGMVILYVQLENPSAFIDPATGLFTANALSIYVNDRYRFDRPFSMFTAKIHFLTPGVDINMERAAVVRTARALMALGTEPAFRIDDDTFCVVYDSSGKMFDKAKNIKMQKDGVKDIPAKGSYLLIPDSGEMKNPEEFFRFLHTYVDAEQEVLVADGSLVDRLREQNRIKDLIDDALANDHIEVFYQPIYDVKNDCFPVAEALARIRKSDGEIVPPGEFIPLAEENGQIIPIGTRVFDKVCRFISSGEAGKLGLKFIEVNLSAAQFDLENPALFVLKYTEKYNIDPGMINLEITETAAAKNRDIMLMNIQKLSEKGVTFSLDDFGTGRSNLDYFVNMPVRNIKFDYSFTQGYFNNEKTRHVLSGMADIFHKMDMHIVSEGIETEEQMEAMKDIGVEYIQGFYYSRPLPETEFLEFLAEKNSQ